MANKSQLVELPLLVSKNAVLFPNFPKVLSIGRKVTSLSILNSKASYDSMIYLGTQIDGDKSEITKDDIYEYGTLCRVVSFMQDEAHLKARIVAKKRVKFTNIELRDGCFYATAEPLEVNPISNEENDILINNIKQATNGIAETATLFSTENAKNLNQRSFESMAYLIFDEAKLSIEDKIEALKCNDLKELYDLALKAVDGNKVNVNTESIINERIRKQSEDAQKEFFLRERLKAVKAELNGGNEAPEDKSEEIERRLKEGNYPENIAKRIRNEMSKADMMPPGSLESSLIQNYVDTLLNLPWWQKTEDNDDIKNVKKILDEDHYGLQKVKKRIIEYLAVKKLTGNLKSPILCFYGPPGCGKTSLGRSIARALDRKFIKASLGGVSDEAEIRGHRRTYVGSMPGRIVNGMKKAGVINPVFLLDEIDKLGSSNKGDPSSAMLEVLDPEQNVAFNDNYVEEPYDLSDVLFICTANYLENIPAPLRDRLELIEVNSYTLIEKVEIAKRHLVAKEIKANGLEGRKVSFTDEAIEYIIEHYTREAGVRQLERSIASCLRKVAVKLVTDEKDEEFIIEPSNVKDYLGIEIFDSTKKETEAQIGVVTGLAYTEYGGEILPIEVTHFPGKGGLVLTGKLGDVMKESATIALDYVRANADKYHIDSKIFMTDDVHIHVPEGAVPKDGPSAGVAITTAIISCLSKTPVNPNIAMTGEVTLRGYALPIGGLREKSLAALRSGIKTIIIPKENKKDFMELPKEIKDNLKVIYMNNVDDAVKNALLTK